jgi:hypothetical protein
MAQPAFQFKITVPGIKELRKKLDTSLYEAEVLEALQDVGTYTADQARKKAPKDTGALQDSIGAVVRYPSLVVQATEPYAVYVEKGTKGGAPGARRYPPINALRGWAGRHGVNPWYLMYKIGRDGTKAQPFMAPAQKKAARKLTTLVKRAQAKVAKRWAKQRKKTAA